MATLPSIADQVSCRLLEMIVCPRDKKELRLGTGRLRCAEGHSYGIFEGIPILLVDDAQQTHIEGERSLLVLRGGEAPHIPGFEVAPGAIDPFVQQSIGATNGTLHQSLIGKLTQYPIPQLRLPSGNGAAFLEIGCSWGRWSIAAARAGYRVIGIDPSLKGIRAAQRVARQLGIDAMYLVADARFLPFRESSFERVFSYSVLQHLSPENVRATLREIRRVLRPDASCTVHMANTYGLRSLQQQARRGFRKPTAFEVRYWTPRQLRKAFDTEIGPLALNRRRFLFLKRAD
jgi:SAM-dependent methyltransferase/uncharacterized protein YbaR (Trm112 family)